MDRRKVGAATNSVKASVGAAPMLAKRMGKTRWSPGNVKWMPMLLAAPAASDGPRLDARGTAAARLGAQRAQENGRR